MTKLVDSRESLPENYLVNTGLKKLNSDLFILICEN